MVFAPAVAYATLKIGRKYGSNDGDDTNDDQNDVDTLVMLSALGGSFIVFFTASVLMYVKYIPTLPVEDRDAAPRNSDMLEDSANLRTPLAGGEEQQEPVIPTGCAMISEGYSTIVQGLKVVWSRKPIFWRMVCVGTL